MIGAVYYWFPKITGRLMDETLGKINFWTMFIGFNVGFFTMHITGLMGMPRRIYTYPAGLGWHVPNLITTIGAFILAFGILLFFINVAYSLRRGAVDPIRGMYIRSNGRFPHRLRPTILR